MEQQLSFQFFERLQNRLINKGYIEVRPPGTYEIALMKQTFGGTLSKVIAIVDASMTTNSPTIIYKNHQDWFKKLLGNAGAGVILFIYYQPSAQIVDEVMKLGSGMLGYGQVVGGVYDISNKKYWMSNHMGWPAEIFS